MTSVPITSIRSGSTCRRRLRRASMQPRRAAAAFGQWGPPVPGAWSLPQIEQQTRLAWYVLFPAPVACTSIQVFVFRWWIISSPTSTCPNHRSCFWLQPWPGVRPSCMPMTRRYACVIVFFPTAMLWLSSPGLKRSTLQTRLSPCSSGTMASVALCLSCPGLAISDNILNGAHWHVMLFGKGCHLR